jgi:hypothetical protein
MEQEPHSAAQAESARGNRIAMMSHLAIGYNRILINIIAIRKRQRFEPF